MGKIDHNRPEHKLKDNATKIRRLLDQHYDELNNESLDAFSANDLHSRNPDEELCLNVLRSHLEEEKAFVNVLSLGGEKYESNSEKMIIRTKYEEKHQEAIKVTDKAIYSYLISAINVQEDKERSSIYGQFHKATVRAAKKGNITAIELLGRIDQVIDGVSKNMSIPNK